MSKLILVSDQHTFLILSKPERLVTSKGVKRTGTFRCAASFHVPCTYRKSYQSKPLSHFISIHQPEKKTNPHSYTYNKEFLKLNHKGNMGCVYYQSEMKLFTTYDIQKLYESVHNSLRKSEIGTSRATAAFGLSWLHGLCSAEQQLGSGFLETGIAPPQRTVRHRPSTVVVLGKTCEQGR